MIWVGEQLVVSIKTVIETGSGLLADLRFLDALNYDDPLTFDLLEHALEELVHLVDSLSHTVTVVMLLLIRIKDLPILQQLSLNVLLV